MATKNDTPPTDDEIKAAEETIRRANEAKATAKRDRLKPIVDMAATTGFKDVRDALAAIPNELVFDPELNAHIQAARAGLAGLERIASSVGSPLAASAT